MDITTPCIVCATQARSKGAALSADRGLTWPTEVVAGHTVHKACSSSVRHLVDGLGNLLVSGGVARWITSGQVLFADTVALLIALGLGDGIDPALTEQTRGAETEAFLAAYRAAQPAQPSGEELAEMRAAFGPGETVVDVITGRKIQL